MLKIALAASLILPGAGAHAAPTGGAELLDGFIMARRATTGGRAWANWWNPAMQQCLLITTTDGVVIAVNRDQRSACRRAQTAEKVSTDRRSAS